MIKLVEEFYFQHFASETLLFMFLISKYSNNPESDAAIK
jgi:hypothetical protein